MRKRRCMRCGVLTHDWEKVGDVVRCWPCGRQTRRDEDQATKRLTRHARLQALADSGCDTWSEYRGER